MDSSNNKHQEDDKNQNLSNDEYERYSRQLIMPTIGLPGQMKLKASKVLIVGAGGLGSPASLYLAGAGIGTIGLVDGDIVEESNLHRQVIHREQNIGLNKTLSAKIGIQQFNHHIDVVTYETHLTKENASDIVKDWDIVMDGSDNAKARYLINDICMILKKPLVSGSALQLEGQVTVYGYKGGPCYRCLFPVPPPPHTVTNCSDGGVLGMVPGLIGQIQAIEIAKIILEVPEDCSLTKRMIFFDALQMKFRHVKLRERSPKCVVCGDNPTITDVTQFDYDDFCSTKCDKYSLIHIPSENNITVEEFDILYKENKDDYALIDVRPPVQYGIVSLPGSVNIPLKQLASNPDSLKELNETKKKIFIMCRRGNASKEATELLLKHGISNIQNIQGGITEYQKKVDPTLPIY